MKEAAVSDVIPGGTLPHRLHYRGRYTWRRQKPPVPARMTGSGPRRGASPGWRTNTPFSSPVPAKSLTGNKLLERASTRQAAKPPGWLLVPVRQGQDTAPPRPAPIAVGPGGWGATSHPSRTQTGSRLTLHSLDPAKHLPALLFSERSTGARQVVPARGTEPEAAVHLVDRDPVPSTKGGDRNPAAL